jgi:hypothetical protein
MDSAGSNTNAASQSQSLGDMKFNENDQKEITQFLNNERQKAKFQESIFPTQPLPPSPSFLSGSVC